MARRAHPAAPAPLRIVVGDDLDLWDACSLLGDGGGPAMKFS